jgi:hypothetical protein
VRVRQVPARRGKPTIFDDIRRLIATLDVEVDGGAWP